MATILYILFRNDIYQKMPDMSLSQERTYFEEVGKGGLMKLFVVLDMIIWLLGFLSLGFWYWKIF